MGEGDWVRLTKRLYRNGRGVRLEKVSKLMGHERIKTRDRHYSKWVKGRQDGPDAIVTGPWFP